MTSRERWAMAALILLAAFLRVAFVGQDVVGGDEVHSLQKLRGHSLGYIVTHFHKPDNCIPITAWCWLLANTVGLEEWGFRLLSWLPGIVLVGLLPYAVRRYLGAGERLLLAAVLATAPLLVYWSREARPYSAITLFAVLAAMALGRYAVDRRVRWLVVSAVSQFLAFAFSPTTSPFLAGLGVASGLGGWLSSRGSNRERLREALGMLAPSIVGLLLILVLLGPALPSLLDEMGSGKQSNTDAHLTTWRESIRIIFGFPKFKPGDPWRYLPVLPLILMLWGTVSLWRRGRKAGAAATIVLLVPLVAYNVADFKGLGSPMVLVRYQAALVPLCLFLMVLGIGDLRRRLAGPSPRGSGALLLFAFGSLAALTALGPVPSALPPGNPFGFRVSRLTRANPITKWNDPAFTPRLYHDLAEAAPAVVVEWPSTGQDEAKYAYYQALHRGRVIRCRQPSRSELRSRPRAGLRFRTFLWEDALLERELPRGAVVVLHRQPAAERAYLKNGARRRRGPQLSEEDDFVQACRSRMGPPFYVDEWVIAFRAP